MKINVQIDVRKLIERGDLKTLKLLLEDQEPAVIYETIEGLESAEKAIIFRLLSKKLAAEVFSHLEFDEQIELLKLFSDEEVKNIIRNMDPADRVDLFDELPADVVTQLLALLPKDEREETLEVLNYPENSAGRVMSPNFVYVYRNSTVKEALEKVRKYGREADTIYTIFVVEEDRTLIGTVKLEELLFADPEELIEEIYEPNPVYVQTTTDQEEVAEVMKKYELNVIPVVDNDLRLVGIITTSDVFEVIDEEFTEDIHKMAGVTKTTTSYFHTPWLIFIKNRLPWLAGLLLLQSLSAFVVKRYEDLIAQVTILTAFMATMVDAGGNTGGQSSSILIRSLALKEVKLKDWWRVFLKELLIGSVLGISLGILLFARGFLITNDVLVNLSAGISLALIIIVANTIGAMLPFMGLALGIDPALLSSPLITTIADLAGMVIFFMIAKAILKL